MASKAWNEAFALQGLGAALSAFAKRKAENKSAAQEQARFEAELAMKMLQVEEAKKQAKFQAWSALRDDERAVARLTQPQEIYQDGKLVGKTPAVYDKDTAATFGAENQKAFYERFGYPAGTPPVKPQTVISSTDPSLDEIGLAGRPAGLPGTPPLAQPVSDPLVTPQPTKKPAGSVQGLGIMPIVDTKTSTKVTAGKVGTVDASGLAQLAATAEKLLNKIPADFWTKSVTQGTTAVLGGKRGMAGSDDVQLYNSNRPALAVGIYRATTGDTRLSDSDAQARALPLVPSIGETAAVRAQKLQAIKRLPVIAKAIMSKLPPDADEASVAAAFSSAVAQVQQESDIAPEGQADPLGIR